MSNRAPRREKRSCFVISPIGDRKSETRARADQMVEKILIPVMRRSYVIDRADKMGRPGVITTEIIKRVADSDLVVADLTGANPNVFYELALRHRTGRPFIQLAEEGTELPFDVQPVQTIFYDLTDPIRLEREVRKELRDQLRYIEEGGPSVLVESPVSMALGIADASALKAVYSWNDIQPMLSALHRKIERDFQADVILTMAGPGSIAALLLQSLDHRNIPVITATTFPQGQDVPTGFESGASMSGYDLIETPKWRVYLPPVVTTLPRGTRVLMFDDRVVTGATHRAAAQRLEDLGCEVRRAALIVSSAAEHETHWYNTISDEQFQFPWGSRDGRG